VSPPSPRETVLQYKKKLFKVYPDLIRNSKFMEDIARDPHLPEILLDDPSLLRGYLPDTKAA
jgi:hypothetical protein